MGWFVTAACVLTALIVAIAYYTYRTAFYASPRKRGELLELPNGEGYEKMSESTEMLSREMRALDGEEIYIRSHDGLRLVGRYYHIADGAPLQIQFHGYRGSAFRDMCGGNKLARKLGHNTLVVDQRAHGQSEGCTIAFGLRERQDCLRWAQYAAERFGKDTKILLTGVSMGAATVLMAADLPLPETVCGIIADSPYASPESIIYKVSGDRGYPPTLAMPFLRLGAWLFGGLRLRESSAVASVRRSRVPILLIHGEADDFVPCDMSRAIFDACASEKRLETFPDAGHGLSYLTDAPRYEQITLDFLDLCGVPVQRK